MRHEPPPTTPAAQQRLSRRLDVVFCCRRGRHRSVACAELMTLLCRTLGIPSGSFHHHQCEWHMPCRHLQCEECVSTEATSFEHSTHMLAVWESAFTPPLVSYRTVPLRPPRQRPLPPSEPVDSDDDTFYGRQIRVVASFRRAHAVMNAPATPQQSTPTALPLPASAPTGPHPPVGPAAAAPLAAAPEKAPPPRAPQATASMPQSTTPPPPDRAAPKKAPPPLRPAATLNPSGDIRLRDQTGSTLTTLRYIHTEGRIARVDEAGRPLPSPLVDPASNLTPNPRPPLAAPAAMRRSSPRAASSPPTRPRAPPLPRQRAQTPPPAFPDDVPCPKPRPLSRPRPLFHSRRAGSCSTTTDNGAAAATTPAAAKPA